MPKCHLPGLLKRCAWAVASLAQPHHLHALNCSRVVLVCTLHGNLASTRKLAMAASQYSLHTLVPSVPDMRLLLQTWPGQMHKKHIGSLAVFSPS